MNETVVGVLRARPGEVAALLELLAALGQVFGEGDSAENFEAITPSINMIGGYFQSSSDVLMLVMWVNVVMVTAVQMRIEAQL